MLNEILSPLEPRNLRLTSVGQEFYPWNHSHAAPCPQEGEREREKETLRGGKISSLGLLWSLWSQLYATGFGGRIVKAKRRRWGLDIPIDLIPGEGSHKLPSFPCLGSARDSALVGKPSGFLMQRNETIGEQHMPESSTGRDEHTERDLIWLEKSSCGFWQIVLHHLQYETHHGEFGWGIGLVMFLYRDSLLPYFFRYESHFIHSEKHLSFI